MGVTIPLDAIACGPTSGTYVEAMFSEMARLRPDNTKSKDSIEMLSASAAMWALTMEQAQDCLVTTNCKNPKFKAFNKECKDLQWPKAFGEGKPIQWSKRGPCRVKFPDGCSMNTNKKKEFIWSSKEFDQEVGGKIVNNLRSANQKGFTVNPQELTRLAKGGVENKLDCQRSYCDKLASHFSSKGGPAFCDATENPALCKQIVEGKGVASDGQATWAKISDSLFKAPSC